MNCQSAAVDPELLLSKEDISILDTDLTFHSTIQPNGFVYKNSAGDEAVITFNQNTTTMFGSFKTHQDKSYAIEKCHHGYVWKEFNVTSFGEDVVQNISLPELPGVDKLAEDGATDTTTEYTYSVMFYVSIYGFNSPSPDLLTRTIILTVHSGVCLNHVRHPRLHRPSYR